MLWREMLKPQIWCLLLKLWEIQIVIGVFVDIIFVCLTKKLVEDAKCTQGRDPKAKTRSKETSVKFCLGLYRIFSNCQQRLSYVCTLLLFLIFSFVHFCHKINFYCARFSVNRLQFQILFRLWSVSSLFLVKHYRAW